MGKKDTGATFTLTQALVSPAVAANGTSPTHATKRAKARLPPTNITSLPALGVTRLGGRPSPSRSTRRGARSPTTARWR